MRLGFLVVALCAACGSPTVSDAGAVDAAPRDGGVRSRDAAPADALAPDADALAPDADALAPDADPADALAPDADALAPDADPADALAPDADPADALAPDALVDALAPDALVDAGVARDDAGCTAPTGVVDDPVAAGLPAGVVLWLRAAHGVATLADGVSVCRWEDVSGNARHFSPSRPTSPRLLPAAVGGRPGVVFSTSSGLEHPDVLGLAPTQGRTIAVRSQVLDTTRRFASVIQGNRANNWEYLELEQNTFNTVGRRAAVYLTANAYDADVATSTAVRTHVYAINSMVPGTVLPGALTYAVDGVVRALTRTPGGNGPSGPGNNRVWSFSGASFTSIGETSVAGFTGGAIGEVLVFDHPLTAPERAAVELHLGQ